MAIAFNPFTGSFVDIPANKSSTINFAQEIVSKKTITDGDEDNILASVNLTTTAGSPIQIIVSGDANPINSGSSWCRLQLYRNEQPIGGTVHCESTAGNINVPYCVNFIDGDATRPAGTYTYSLRVIQQSGGSQFEFGEVTGAVISAVELTKNVTQNDNNVNIGDITFEGVKIIGNTTTLPQGSIELIPNNETIPEWQPHGGDTYTSHGQFVKIYPTWNEDVPHIHIAPGQGENASGHLFLGDDYEYVQVGSEQKVKISTIGSSKEFKFQTGSVESLLQLPDNGKIVHPNDPNLEYGTYRKSKLVALDEELELDSVLVKVIDVSNPRTGGDTPGYWITIAPSDENSTTFHWSIIETPYKENSGYGNNTVSVIGKTTTNTWFTPGGSGDTYTPTPLVNPPYIEQEGAIAIVIITDIANGKVYRITWQVLDRNIDPLIFPLCIEKLIG